MVWAISLVLPEVMMFTQDPGCHKLADSFRIGKCRTPMLITSVTDLACAEVSISTVQPA